MFWSYVLSAYGITLIMLIFLTIIIVSKNRHSKALLAGWECDEG